ncbi:MAG TPA: hypothetical protein VFN36_07295 [Solirubrobacteraceae bacterium]|nr:hypothetical protein [Solirubrobacteraceae bacterium]
MRSATGRERSRLLIARRRLAGTDTALLPSCVLGELLSHLGHIFADRPVGPAGEPGLV